MTGKSAVQKGEFEITGGLRPAIVAIFSIAMTIVAPSAANAQLAPGEADERLAENARPGDIDEYALEYAAGSALGLAVGQQVTVGNTAVLNGDDARVDIIGAANNATGIIGVNQEAGAGNAQGNVVAIALDDSAGAAAALASASEAQVLRDNTVFDGGGDRVNLIADSFNNTSGIVQVSQATGAFNQHLHVAVIALGGIEGAGFAQLDDAGLADVRNVEGNAVDHAAGVSERSGRIENSFNGFTGIAQVSQTAGNLNQVSQSIGIGIGGTGG